MKSKIVEMMPIIQGREASNGFCFRLLVLFFLVILWAGLCQKVSAETTDERQINLQRAVICENVHDLKPINPAIAFSLTIGKVVCYTEFSNITQETFILHKWYRQDALVTEKKLLLKPPRWSTYSSIQLRESDKGPWRVDVVNADGKTLQILRFSVTE